VVVEASWRSGALNTAGHAADLGRTVAAVPGPVTSSTSAGCHRLIREGAVCVTDAAEVLELLGPLDATRGPAPPPVAPGLLDGLDATQAVVLDALPARAGAELASLVRSSGLAEEQVRSSLGVLELAGGGGRRGAGEPGGRRRAGRGAGARLAGIPRAGRQGGAGRGALAPGPARRRLTQVPTPTPPHGSRTPCFAATERIQPAKQGVREG